MDSSVYEFISQQTNDPIIERRTCTISGEQFPIFQSDVDFYNKISPTFNGQKFPIPFPTLCPEERQKRRLLFRNERNLYRRTCSYSGKNIISMYSPEKTQKIFSSDIRRSDLRNPQDYSLDIDLNKEVNETIHSLVSKIPMLSSIILNGQNAEYTNYTSDVKNCYLSFRIKDCEDIYYSYLLFENCQNCIDCSHIIQSKLSYQCIECQGLYACKYCKNCIDCTNCIGCLECNNCQFCINCFGLQNKKYHINNQPVAKEDFDKYKTTNRHFQGVKIKPNQRNINSEKCIGNNNTHCKNIVLGFDNTGYENAKYISCTESGENALDVDYYTHSGRGYETISAMRSQKIYFSYAAYDSSNIFYSILVINCHHCFGCVGLRNKSYCIYNKQYTPDTYEQEVAKIINTMIQTGERGEFLKPSLSMFGYNETVAYEYFPITQEQAKQLGYKRQIHNYDVTIPKGKTVIEELPTNNTTTYDQIKNSVFICKTSGKPYSILEKEYNFYKTQSISIPDQHPDQRHKERMDMREKRTLHLRTCDKTGESMLSIYPANTPFPVYNEKSYNQQVYG